METSAKEIWNECLAIIKDNIPAQSYKTWFLPIIPLNIDNNLLTIQVPSPFFHEYIEAQYIDILSSTLKRTMGQNAKLAYRVVVDSGRKNNFAQNNNSQQGSMLLPGTNPSNTRHTFNNINNNINNNPKTFNVQSPQNQQEPTIRNPFIIPGIKKININPQLNPNYTIDNFIEGECNRLGRSAAEAIVNQLSKTPFNPLLIHGDSGLGKTHLAQAIGNSIKNMHPEKLVLYVSANKFQTQYCDAVRSNNRNDFIHFYQILDVLIIDDVQEFAGKQSTQDTFFHIFNQLQQNGKQIILTCDKNPSELKGLSKRLLSRFRWGLVAEITVPDFETRLNILRQKAYNDGINIPEDVLEYIAENVISNVRELEGALISLLAQSTLNRKEITLELTKSIMEKVVRKPKNEFSLDYILKVVCNYFKMTPEILNTKSRKREIVQARQLAMYFAKTLTTNSLAVIGMQIGNRDHSTVLHACKTIEDLLQTDKQLKAIYDEIETKLKFANNNY
ncbi:MAG: chromosomal replication initiator protein DnaA [Bacteroidales bacterium]|nr:chromosomal replication initiator protein DnaA [Bacteroidales bacterium]